MKTQKIMCGARIAMEVLCTNGLKSVMTEIAPALERRCGSRLVLTWGSTVALAQQFATDPRGDIAVLTGEAIDDLIARGKAVAGSRVDLARSGIGIAVGKGARKPDIGSPEALRQALLAAESVAYSKTGQSGIYFPTVLDRLGITEKMQGKLVVPESGVPIGEIVARGEAQMGIQQISELLPVDGIEIVGQLPPALQKITVFSAGVLATAREPEHARSLIELVASASRPLLGAKGLEAP
jgi:molybdate transport system substrate-binding protein